MLQNFFFFISKEENVKTLNKKNAKFQEAVEIVNLSIEDEINGVSCQEQFEILKQFMVKYIKMYQIIFANLFPKFFGKNDNRSIQNNIEFNTIYTTYLNQKNVLEWQKNNQYWENQIKISENQIKKEKEVFEIIDNLKNETNQTENDKMQQKQMKINSKKRNLEEKLKENTEKMKKIKNK